MKPPDIEEIAVFEFEIFSRKELRLLHRLAEILDLMNRISMAIADQTYDDRLTNHEEVAKLKAQRRFNRLRLHSLVRQQNAKENRKIGKVFRIYCIRLLVYYQEVL